jgi:hypothetical protein
LVGGISDHLGGWKVRGRQRNSDGGGRQERPCQAPANKEKVMATMLRTRRTPLRFDGDRRTSPETPRILRDGPRNATGRRISAAGSDVVVVASPPKRTPAPIVSAPTEEEEDVSGKGPRKERVRDKHGRYTDGAVTTNKKLVIEIPKRKTSGVNTPIQSSNESPASTIRRPRHRINLRSKGIPLSSQIPPSGIFR